MDCSTATESCTECGGATLANIDGIDSEMIALVLDAAEAHELDAILDGYGARLAYAAERGFVAIVGADCDADSPTVSHVVFLSKEKASAVAAHAAVRKAEDFAGFSLGSVSGTYCSSPT